MLIKEKLETFRFSPAEETVASFLLTSPEQIEHQSIHKLAKANFTQPSTLVRLAKKLGFKGWSDFKKAYLEEWHYLQRHFVSLDPNLPFSATDSLITISNKLIGLSHATLDDMQDLLDHHALNLAQQLLLEAKHLAIFAQSGNLLIAQDFALKMNRIGWQVSLANLAGEERYHALNLPPDSCAILISYSGENTTLIAIQKILKKRGIPSIAITSIGDSKLAQAAQVHLPMTTREKFYSKIGNFTTNLSIIILLDILYALVFADNYSNNLKHLIQSGKIIDHRKSHSQIMQEGEGESNE